MAPGPGKDGLWQSQLLCYALRRSARQISPTLGRMAGAGAAGSTAAEWAGFTAAALPAFTVAGSIEKDFTTAGSAVTDFAIAGFLRWFFRLPLVGLLSGLWLLRL
jgi:hypothetical protein